jgi:phosphoribosylglycinamide formyltransferase-1
VNDQQKPDRFASRNYTPDGPTPASRTYSPDGPTPAMRYYTPGEKSPGKKKRLGVLISGSGSNLQAIIDASEAGKLPNAEIAVVICNNPKAAGLQRALKHKLPAVYIPWGKYPVNPDLTAMTPNEVQVDALLKLYQVDLVVLAGWMRIFSAPFLESYTRRIINIHPALLPSNGSGDTYKLSNGEIIPVLRGMHCVQKALDAGLTTTGSSVHYITPIVDAGPVICQQEERILPGDTEEILQDRLKTIEHSLIVEAIMKITS